MGQTGAGLENGSGARLSAEEILAKAADLVEFSGRWRQHPTTSSIKDGICLMLALVEASRSAPHQYTVVQKTVWYEIGVCNDCGAFAWNDAPGRTKEEVATALRNAKRHLA